MIYININILSISRVGPCININILPISKVGPYFNINIWTIFQKISQYGPSIWSVRGLEHPYSQVCKGYLDLLSDLWPRTACHKQTELQGPPSDSTWRHKWKLAGIWTGQSLPLYGRKTSGTCGARCSGTTRK